jgi:iron complex transport system substrate-binding protein
MKHLIISTGIFLLLCSCDRFGKEDTKGDHKERIVCISKQYSEYIYALGAEKDIVAVDISSVYPAEVKKLPTVGYHRALSLEGIMAASPTLILHEGRKSLGPDHVVTQLEQLKIPMKTFHAKSGDIDGAKELLREMGTYFHKEKKADSLCAKLDMEMKTALDKAKEYKDKPRVLVIHFGQAKNIYMVMTKKGGPVAKMIEWAGGEMALQDTSNMKQMSAEFVTKSDPDVILLTEYGYDRLGSPEKIKELPGVSLTKAFKSNRVYRIEAHDLIYLGPRTGENTLKLQTLIHKNGAE